MKSLTTNLMLATAALTVVSTVASAQALTAEIPFAFQSAGTVMAPGTYMVRAYNGEVYFQLRNQESHQIIQLMAGAPHDPPQAWQKAGHPVLEFACVDRRCALKRIWTAKGLPAHEFDSPKTEEGRPTRLALIRLVVGRAN